VTFDTHRTARYERPDPRSWHYDIAKFRREVAEAGLEIEQLHRGIRRSELGWRRFARAVIRNDGAARAERRSWIDERDEDVA